jgi:hypothetical protein
LIEVKLRGIVVKRFGIHEQGFLGIGAAAIGIVEALEFKATQRIRPLEVLGVGV